MAKTQMIQFSEEEDPTEVLMVSHAVGKNAANYWTDIQLVQYMIGKIYFFKRDEKGDWKHPMTAGELAALPNPAVDFKALDRTTKLIARFQSDAKKELPVTVDGRVDPAVTAIASITKTAYTILVANFYLQSAMEAVFGTGTDWIGAVLSDDDLPPGCRAQIAASRASESAG